MSDKIEYVYAPEHELRIVSEYKGSYSVPATLQEDHTLTANCRLTYGFLSNFFKNNGYAICSDKWIAQKAHMSVCSVQRHLNELEAKNYIFRQTIQVGLKKYRRIWEYDKYRIYLLDNQNPDEEFKKSLRILPIERPVYSQVSCSNTHDCVINKKVPNKKAKNIKEQHTTQPLKPRTVHKSTQKKPEPPVPIHPMLMAILEDKAPEGKGKEKETEEEKEEKKGRVLLFLKQIKETGLSPDDQADCWDYFEKLPKTKAKTDKPFVDSWPSYIYHAVRDRYWDKPTYESLISKEKEEQKEIPVLTPLGRKNEEYILKKCLEESDFPGAPEPENRWLIMNDTWETYDFEDPDFIKKVEEHVKRLEEKKEEAGNENLKPS